MERGFQVRRATQEDARVIAAIYNTGIDERTATFETRLRTEDEVRSWFEVDQFPVVAVEVNGQVVAFASTSAYSSRDCYRGIAECSVYVAREARGLGAGRVALEALIAASREAGFWKLVSRIFPENVASRRLVARCGFREVGAHHRHAKLDGVWKDVVVVERLL